VNDLPERFSGNESTGHSMTAIVVKVLHQVDGAVIVRVAQGQPASEEVDPSA